MKTKRNAVQWEPLAATGYRASNTGDLIVVGVYGYAWSSSPYSATSVYGSYLGFESSLLNIENFTNRARGLPVRCVQE